MIQFFKDLLNVFYPKLCCSCNQTLVGTEEILCFGCMSTLPKIDNPDPSENELKSRFDGKLKIEYAFAQLQFQKSGITQKLLHQFKYNHKPEIGELFGRQLGVKIMDLSLGECFNLIIPVPLHPKKHRQRGYNQSQYIASGISEITGIAVDLDHVRRVKHSDSQTGKTREKRWKSVEDAFTVTGTSKLKSKHILLVDDVITTGATIEACGLKLRSAGVGKISVATMALAK